jgi:hypothetical protein
MHFFVPFFLAGLAAVAIPVGVHLIGRRRAPVVRFAALDFLLSSRRRVAQRLRLRRILLMILRVGAVAAIALVLAKPYREASGASATVSAGPQSAVILLDDSAGMTYSLDGDSLFAHAQSKAAQIITELGPESEVAILLTSSGSQAPVAELSSDRNRLLGAVEEAHVTYRSDDLRSALAHAASILATAPHPERDVYVISDLAAHTITPEALAEVATQGQASNQASAQTKPPAVHLVDAADGAALPNHAIVRVNTEPAPELGARGLRVTATVANFSDSPITDVPVTLEIDGTALARGFVDVAPHVTSDKRFDVSLPSDQTGALAADVSLPGDALNADDHRFFPVSVTRVIHTLVVDGDPRTERREDEAFYLSAALAAGGGPASSSIDVTVVTGDGLAHHPLQGVDVVFLCNVKSLTADEVTALDDYVTGGGGLFISVGDNVDPDTWNQQLGQLLPEPLGPVHSALGAGAAGLDAPGAESLGSIDTSSPLFSVFPPDANAVRDARFARYVLVLPQPGAGPQVLARFESGAPAFIEATHGDGKIVFFASTIDRDWNDLPIRPGFLPLVQQAVHELAHAPITTPDQPTLVGREHDVPLHGDETSLVVTPPNGSPVRFEKDALTGRASLPFLATDTPGIYRVAVTATRDGDANDQPNDLFAVNLDPVESDLTRVSADALDGPSGATSATLGVAPPRQVPLWSGIAAILLALLLGESILTRRS